MCCNKHKCVASSSYKGADKYLARPDKKKKNNWKFTIFRPAEVIAAAETCLDGQPSELFLSGLTKVIVWSL